MAEEPARDSRRNTFLKVQVRSDSGWSEAIVCNVSSHGMMLRGEDLPGRGSFIEIVGGKVSLAGHVRWSLAGRCGIRTREVIDLAALLGTPGSDATPPAPPRRSRPGGEAATSPADRAAQSRARGRVLDLALTLALLTAGAWLVISAVNGLFAAPLGRIGSELSCPGR